MIIVYKKGQGLSLNVVILAILAIVVLAILTFFLTTQAGKFQQEKESCTGKGGVCAEPGLTSEDPRIPSGFVEKTQYSCPNTDQVCYANPIVG